MRPRLWIARACLAALAGCLGPCAALAQEAVAEFGPLDG
jgi:hypothetical protein